MALLMVEIVIFNYRDSFILIMAKKKKFRTLKLDYYCLNITFICNLINMKYE